MSTDDGTALGGLSAGEFLESVWHKKPLLIRAAFPKTALQVQPADVLALATEAGVRSRWITMPDQERNGSARTGPFDASEFSDLPAAGWTLLVHEADRRIASLRTLFERFRFIPNWRLDDVMVSLAPDGGGIGPHVDRYDVFLLQGLGRRRWRIREAPLTGNEHPTPGAGIRVLDGIEFDREFELSPGDMLYLPPGVPHDGIALGQSITYSIGFRAPDPRELCSSFMTSLPPSTFDAIRYADPDLVPAADPGEIPAAALARLRTLSSSLFAEGGPFDAWVGRYVTRPLRDTAEVALPGVTSLPQLRELLKAGGSLRRSAPPHFAWSRDDGGVQLFVGGEAYDLPQDAESQAQLLCGLTPLAAASLTSHLDDERFVGILFDLLVRGFLIVCEPEA